MNRTALAAVLALAAAPAQAGNLVTGTGVAPALAKPANGIGGIATAPAGLPGGVSLGAAVSGPRFNILDYCASTCTSRVAQTSAFLAVAALMEAKGGYATLYVPSGQWQFDGTAGPMTFTKAGENVVGDGANATTITVTGGNFAAWTTGFSAIAGFRLYETDNPPSGAQILLDQTHRVTMDDVQLGGGFVSLDLASAVYTYGTNIIVAGNNTTTGSIGMRVHAHPGGINSSTNDFANLNISALGPSAPPLTHALVLSNSDGFSVVNGHIGWANNEVLLIQPEFAGDVIDNVTFTGTVFDKNPGYGVHFSPFAGTFTGYIGEFYFTGGESESASLDCFRVDDPAATRIYLTGFKTLNCGASGVNLQAGSHIAIVGGGLSNSNISGGGVPHIEVGGTASNVTIDGVDFDIGGPNNPPYAISIDGTADYVTIGTNTYYGSTPVNVTSSGAHNNVTSISLKVMSPAGVQALQLTAGSSNTRFGVIQAATAGDVLFYGNGAGGTSVPVTFESVAGPTTIGNNGGVYGARIGVGSGSADPTTSDVPSNYCQIWKNTTGVTFKLWCNFGGTLKSATLN